MRYVSIRRKLNLVNTTDNSNKPSKLTNQDYFLALSLIVFFLGTPIQLVNADPLDIIEFDSSEYTHSDSAYFTVYETLGDLDCPESGSNISVEITSTITEGEIRDSFVLDAIEIDDPTPGIRNPTLGTCIFGNTVLNFMTPDQTFSIGDTITAFENLEKNGEKSDNVITTVDVELSSSSDPDGITLTLTETGPNTGLFENTFLLTSESSVENSALHAEPGNILTMNYQGELFHGQVFPRPNEGEGVLVAQVGDTITATYNGISGTTVLIKGGGSGGSGGGLVISRIVLDVLAGGTSGGDFAPPQLVIPKLNLSSLPLVGDILNFITNADPFTPITPMDNPSIDYPISINDRGFLLTQYANTIETYTGNTGEPVSFKMNLMDTTGVEHIGVYTNLRGDHREISDSDTYLIYNEDQPLEITDPHGFFSNVNFTESEYNGKYVAEFNMTFAKPMDTSDIIIRTWDELRNSGDIKVFDALMIEGSPIVNPATNDLIIPDSTKIVVPYYKMPYYDIPEADSNGNLVYHNSFGGMEEKQVHPYYNPTIYPDEIGKNYRHSKEFSNLIETEKTKSQIMLNELVVNPFVALEKSSTNESFFYPDTVGRLDRRNTDTLTDNMNKENTKAVIISTILYKTNQILD